MKDKISHQELTRLLKYDPESGFFSWIVKRKGKSLTKEAGHLEEKDGYIRIRISGIAYAAHRLAWFYTHSVWPPVVIDHIDGVRTNNRLSNLRLATLQENQFNRKVKRTSQTGSKGVSVDTRSGRFQVQISSGGVKKFLGYFSTIAEGAAAYKAAATKIHGKFLNV